MAISPNLIAPTPGSPGVSANTGRRQIGPGPVILYDGVCGLCNRYVQFVLANDSSATFRFATLQGAYGTRVLARHGFGPDSVAPDSVVLVEFPETEDERIRLRSDAILGIVAGLKAPWRWLAGLRLVPRGLRDALYDIIARIRYRVFGRLESCALPSPQSRPRFLD